MEATARTRRRAHPAHRVAACLALGLTLAALQLTIAAPAWSATSAVTSAVASPAAFVPDWDGHTDSTVLTYELATRSDVTIRVVGPRGRVVAAMHVGVRDAGRQEATWDGRDDTGAVLAPGTYALRVDARPAAAAVGTPGASALGGSVTVAGARATTVTLQRADVVLTGVALSRASVGAKGRSSNTSARFHLSSAATVSAAIVDSSGAVVRTLATRPMRAGVNALRWNGRQADGRSVADGTYALVVAATAGGRPTDTIRLPLTVDRAIPTLTATRRVTATIDARGRVRIPLSIVASEDASLTLQLGRRTHRTNVKSGSSKVTVDGASIGVRGTRTRRTVTMAVRLVDGAGNLAGARTVVVIPALTRRQAANPTPAPPTDPGPRTPVPSGSWPWPVGGIVTSEFGLRDGRPHTGLDIAVPTGTPIHPSIAGTVSFVGVLGGYGNLVIVEHANGMRTYYAHMSRFGGFAVGAAVTHLDTIGMVGCTGNCTGPHLHFETRTADTPRDPRSYLTAR